ncbi:MAG: hypothetical protein HGA56_05680 [Chlorobiaceae bacterium]|nr:hypothetical protein [Chlorobiaceae bacterium]
MPSLTNHRSSGSGCHALSMAVSRSLPHLPINLTAGIDSVVPVLSVVQVVIPVS